MDIIKIKLNIKEKIKENLNKKFWFLKLENLRFSTFKINLKFYRKYFCGIGFIYLPLHKLNTKLWHWLFITQMIIQRN